MPVKKTLFFLLIAYFFCFCIYSHDTADQAPLITDLQGIIFTDKATVLPEEQMEKIEGVEIDVAVLPARRDFLRLMSPYLHQEITLDTIQNLKKRYYSILSRP